MTGPVVLGIETSCDETAAAVVSAEGGVLSSVVSSQVDVHAVYGGVVPELAGRAHLELLNPVIDLALTRAGSRGATRSGSGFTKTKSPVDAVAATIGPGLIGALLVGLSEAKALSLAWGVPFAGVNHLEGHLFATLIDHREIDWPLAVLLVSGGHTMLVSMEGPGRYRLLGETVDDAAGEAFDKVARFLGLGYPGGPAIERIARGGDPTRLALPRAMLEEGLDMSFSGLKTAVVRSVKRSPEISNEDVAASFQQAVVDVLVTKTLRAAERVHARGVCLAGGVAANGPLRRALAEAAAGLGLGVFLPSREMCTDNAAMVAAAGAWQLEHIGPTPLDIGADPGLRLTLIDLPG
ncbi:MAG TPA: tRNA (adenosine(37)-N6)-threonylcarbamoyltransferase complex transferase subunit TsaD [Acidimicrobiales bacterium]|nr:tRNA (adenosine(37)-N6)-threonylcarbamoyltransferase complex transferase subunit TsaD [Acidimicrobiales bacterium]